MESDTQVAGRVREPGPSIHLRQQLIFFYRENGECTEFSVVGEPTEQDGVYSAICKYTKKVSLNSTSESKEFAKFQYLQDLDQFLISACLVNVIGHLLANIPNL